MSEEVSIKARVAEFVAHAHVDHYEGGATQSFAATSLEVLEPEDLGRKTLTIYHEREVPAASPWRRPGTLVLLRMNARDLEVYDMLFAGAVREMEVLHEGGGAR